MKKTTGTLMFILALFFSFILSTPVQAVVVPGLTGVEDGEAYNTDKLDIGISAEGKYTLKLADTSDNIQEITFWIDRTSPTVTGVENNAIYNDDRQITLDDGINGSGIDSVMLDGQDIIGTLIDNTFTVGEGTHTLVVKDKAENGTVPETINFTIQKQQIKPTITGLTIKQGPQWDDPENELWGYTYEIEATGDVNGNVFTATDENVVITNAVGETVSNYFSRGEDYYSFNGELYPDEGYYRVYIKDDNGNLSENCLLLNWRDYPFYGSNHPAPLTQVQDNAIPSIIISAPSEFEAVNGESITYTVTYSDDVEIGAITLSTSDVKVYNDDVEISRSVSITETGNTRIITVPVGSETGTLGIRIQEHSAYDVAGKYVHGINSTNFRVNTTPFVYDSVKVYSKNQISDPNEYAKVGDVVYLEFTTSESVATTPTVKIFGKPAMVSGSGENWTAVYTTEASNAEGEVDFEITCDAGDNVYPTSSETTDGSSVTLEKTVPNCNINDGSSFNNNKIVNFSDTLSGIYSAVISKNSQPATPIQNNTNIQGPGSYELTMTDFAGNVKKVRFTIVSDKPTIINKTLVYITQWDDPDNEEWGRTYKLIATGTDSNGNAFTADAEHVIVRTDSDPEEDVVNGFDYIEGYYSGGYNAPSGNFRVYIMDQAGNISDNYLTFTW